MQLYSARQKLARADKHLEELKRSASPLSSELYSFGWRSGKAVNGGMEFGHPSSLNGNFVQLVFAPDPNIRAKIGCVIGDIIGNIRSSLDLAISQLTGQNDIIGKFNFPFVNKRSEFALHPSVVRLQEIFTSSNPAKFFHDYIWDYVEPNSNIKLLNKMRNADKHELILPIVSIADIRLNEAVSNKYIIGNYKYTGPADSPFALITVAGVDPRSMKIDAEFEVSVKLAFDNPAELQSALPILHRMRRDCEKVICKLERNFA